MERHLKDLESRDERLTLDDLDSASQPHRPVGAPVPLPRGRARWRRVRPRRERTPRGPVLPGLLVVGLILVGVFLFDPSASGQRLRELVGFDGRLGEVVGAEGDGEYAFLATQPGSDEPVSWNPCRPIRYVVNPDGAPDDWEDLVDEAVQDIEDASGFRFEDTGTSDEREFDDRIVAARPLPVLIGWADEDEVPGLAGDVAGLGGSISEEVNRHVTYVTGRVILDSELFEDLDRQIGGSAQMRAIITHELAHVVGLDHVDDKGELMYPDTTDRTRLGPGDLKGLALLGAVDCA